MSPRLLYILRPLAIIRTDEDFRDFHDAFMAAKAIRMGPNPSPLR